MLFYILGLITAAGVWAFFTWERHDMAKAHIHADLKRARATPISIKADWMDMDRDTLTYDVVYTDARGERVHNSCKVGIHQGVIGDVYWHTPVR